MANFSKPTVPQFSVEVYQNEYLPEGGREVNAIVTVTATGGGTVGSAVGAPHLYSPGTSVDAAVALMVDCSGSMDYPPTKMRGAREASAAAIDTLRDGVHFAVIAGTHVAKEIYPGNGRLAVADATTRDQAKQALRKLSAGGGTAIGTWLRLADRLLYAADPSGSMVRHGILLTDGRNEHESPEDLRATLDATAGRFTCDARGVGTDWEVKEVTGIASALLGTADIIADPAHLAEDFTQMMETAMGKEVADVSLRLWTPLGSEIKFVKQVAPTVEELTERRTEAGPRAGDYPTGSWGDESRDYHVCVQVPTADLGQEMLAARVSLVIPQSDGSAQTVSQGLVRAVWTDDMAASTSINPQVAHYTGQAELAQVIQQGLDARKAGDDAGATAKLGRAVQLAALSGNADTAKLLSKVVDVVDAAEGTVRLKPKVAEADEMTLETRSTKTVRVKK
ncbi:VWA domain-containing protein [Streptomyces sp. NPDC059639]|uniref:vWA domain-containing protein n=1 Tax=Streptomyces sp. NPDC059639 TaxID=3346891 RepID=UPI00367ACEEB